MQEKCLAKEKEGSDLMPGIMSIRLLAKAPSQRHNQYGASFLQGLDLDIYAGCREPSPGSAEERGADTRVRVSGASLGFQLNSKLLSHPLHTTALHLPSHTLSWPVSYLLSTEHSPDTPTVCFCF